VKFLTDQHLTIAGHKVPLALLGVLATVGAAILLMRNANSQNAQAAVAAQASGSGVFGGASGADVSGQLQNLQSQLAGFSSGLAQLQSMGTVPAAPSQPGLIAVSPGGATAEPAYHGGSGASSPAISSAARPIAQSAIAALSSRLLASVGKVSGLGGAPFSGKLQTANPIPVKNPPQYYSGPLSFLNFARPPAAIPSSSGGGHAGGALAL